MPSGRRLNAQHSLFSATELRGTKREERITARNARRKHDALKLKLTQAEGDLADCEFNIREVAMHQRASREGIVDENWWDGAIRFGIWHHEVGMTIREDGRYPIKVMRWIRHLLRVLHAEARDIRAAIETMRPEVDRISSLMNSLSD